MNKRKWGYKVNKEQQLPSLLSALQQILGDLQIQGQNILNFQMLLDILKLNIKEPIRIVFKLDAFCTPQVCLFKPQVYKSPKPIVLIKTYLVESSKTGIELIESKSYYQCDEQLSLTQNSCKSQTSLDETGVGLFRTITDQKCQICEESYRNSIQLPCCAYQNHLDCFQKYLNSYDCYTFEGYICQNYQCKQPISVVYLEQYMDPKKYQYIQAHYKPGYMRCPVCEIYCFMGDQQEVECECHYKILFKLSGQDKIMINDLEDMKTPFIICPFCNQVTTKDDGCNHVTCVCKKELCSLCSVDRIPILAHGAHYHRKGCKHHSEFREEYDPEKCIICRINGQKCSYPQSLEDYMISKRKI
ncbi:hypothetical protein pb186bvf_018021 [Paramecium bursaria]